MRLSDKDILKIIDFFNQLFNAFISLIRILIWSRPVRLPVLQRDECIILGNGPSLSQNLENNLDLLMNRLLICVNYFPKSPYFQQLKPQILIVCDPQFWKSTYPPDVVDERNRLYCRLAETVDWNLYFFVPMRAKKHNNSFSVFKSNKHIKIVYYNATPIEGFTFFKNLGFRKKLGMPRPRNVLIPTIHLAILLKIKKIVILGAEHSWINELYVDKNNNVLLRQKHFYKERVEAKPFLLFGKEARMPDLMKEFFYVFSAYFDLQRFSEYMGVEVINCAPVSYIDAFKKQDLKEALKS